jgi:hypothetical protein
MGMGEHQRAGEIVVLREEGRICAVDGLGAGIETTRAGRGSSDGWLFGDEAGERAVGMGGEERGSTAMGGWTGLDGACGDWDGDWRHRRGERADQVGAGLVVAGGVVCVVSCMSCMSCIYLKCAGSCSSGQCPRPTAVFGESRGQSTVQFTKPSSARPSARAPCRAERRPWQPSSGFPRVIISILVRLQSTSSLNSSTISTSRMSCAFGRYGTPVFLSKTIHSAGPQVNKHFERISRHAAVWKRLLRRLKLPLPHLPWPISALSAAQTELVIRRATSVNRHWASRPRAVGVALDSYDKPYIIKFAPGGRYLVAATRNVRDNVFGVVIWDLETPNTPTALVRYQTRTLLSSFSSSG